MEFKNSFLAVVVSAVVLTLLFYKQGIGLNLLIFETLFILWLVFNKHLQLKSTNQLITTIGFVATSVFTVINYSIFGYVVHFLCAFIFIGILNYGKVKSIANACAISVTTILLSQDLFFQRLLTSGIKGNKIGSLLWKSRIFIAPVLIIFVFVSLYSFSNPVFNDLVGNIGFRIESVFNFVFENFNFWLLLTFIFCFFTSVFLLIRTQSLAIAKRDSIASEFLNRTRHKLKRSFKLTALKNEYRAGIFLLVVLNAILLALNIIDISTIWFNFEWEGQTLKQFVHEGTYLLIFSILISIGLVLYFFRGNLNFYKKNRFLKYLSYIWLAQNALLVISVGVRNFWYIEYFAMASKRIGVIVFLLLTLYGLFTVFRKIQHRKSTFYLFKYNTLAIYVAIVVASFVNWDAFIVRYNFAHSDQSYLHLEYLAELSDKTIPLQDRSLHELELIETFQKKKFEYDENDMTIHEYQNKINRRKIVFKKKWEEKNILAWNLAEHRTYEALFGSKP